MVLHKQKYIHFIDLIYVCEIFECFLDGWMDGCRFESNCPLVGPGTIGRLPSVEVFLRDLSPYLREFQRKPRKIPNG